MASTPLFYDRVLETSTTTGTGTLTLTGAVTGYQTFGAVGNGNSCQYYIEGVDASAVPTGEWEVGIGTYTTSGTTLSRTKILSSSNSGNVVTLSAGTKRVGLCAPVAANAVPVISDFGGRLTLETLVPISTADQTGKNHLFYTPYLHNRTPKWNGSGWERVTFAEYDFTLTGLTSGKGYDVWWDGSALSLSTAWTNDTTRADALGTQDGVLCLGSDHTKLLVGSIYTTATTTTEDSNMNRYVSNLYNDVPRSVFCKDTTNLSWNYSTDAYRQADAVATNQVAAMFCAVGKTVTLALVAHTASDGGAAVGMAVAIGEDSTTAPDSLCHPANFLPTTATIFANVRIPMVSTLTKIPTAGRHKYVWLETGNGNAVAQWYGTRTSGTIDFVSGISGWVRA